MDAARIHVVRRPRLLFVENEWTFDGKLGALHITRGRISTAMLLCRKEKHRFFILAFDTFEVFAPVNAMGNQRPGKAGLDKEFVPISLHLARLEQIDRERNEALRQLDAASATIADLREAMVPVEDLQEAQRQI
ncbi:hypothetical protein [Thetidibacter halocola]|uniref:Uncharacterized protein n=1 Tax=Thetidibacter halocola TaxID=2827239 RepID=A0A8J7WJN5_9RHOB|nr:hypothetical protein [Thetidibacter halocola]MBS0126548.1 hypothetical protein [Thetidibacter halocola]